MEASVCVAHLATVVISCTPLAHLCTVEARRSTSFKRRRQRPDQTQTLSARTFQRLRISDLDLHNGAGKVLPIICEEPIGTNVHGSGQMYRICCAEGIAAS